METELSTSEIQQKIHTIRGCRVILDNDLANFYQIETKYLNRVTRRNPNRFPADFAFQLAFEEYEILRCQFVTLKVGRGGHKKYLRF